MEYVTIFTDGSSLGNPGPGGFGAILHLKKEGIVVELGGGNPKTTNNRMEMMALIESLKFLREKGISELSIDVYADSQYVINGATKWIYGWQENGWMTKNKVAVLNKDLWQEIFILTQDFDIEWHYVEGHAGIPGNERVDEIATSFASHKDVTLFSGKAQDYAVDLKNLTPMYAKKDSSSSKKPYSYLSMVDGKIETHKTWAECEARVKGREARFKKTFSKDEETKLISEWLSNER
jgi:ribonuclease HI